MPIYRAVNKDFFKKWSPEMAYIVGFFAADGYITVNRRGGQFWCIQITDKDILESIKTVVQSNHKIGMRRRRGNEQVIYRLQIGSIEMCNDLRALGFVEKKTKNLAVHKVPSRYFGDFVRGYFDGDGNVWAGFTKKHRGMPSLSLLTAFTSCSREFLCLLLKGLNKHGIEGGSIYDAKENYSRLQLGMRDSLRLYDVMYTKTIPSDLQLLRKKEVFERFASMKKDSVLARQF